VRAGPKPLMLTQRRSSCKARSTEWPVEFSKQFGQLGVVIAREPLQ